MCHLWCFVVVILVFYSCGETKSVPTDLKINTKADKAPNKKINAALKQLCNENELEHHDKSKRRLHKAVKHLLCKQGIPKVVMTHKGVYSHKTKTKIVQDAKVNFGQPPPLTFHAHHRGFTPHTHNFTRLRHFTSSVQHHPKTSHKRVKSILDELHKMPLVEEQPVKKQETSGKPEFIGHIPHLEHLSYESHIPSIEPISSLKHVEHNSRIDSIEQMERMDGIEPIDYINSEEGNGKMEKRNIISRSDKEEGSATFDLKETLLEARPNGQMIVTEGDGINVNNDGPREAIGAEGVQKPAYGVMFPNEGVTSPATGTIDGAKGVTEKAAGVTDKAKGVTKVATGYKP